MGRAKEIIVKVVPSKIGNEFIKKHHYSGKVVHNSTLHFGVFLDGRLHGVISFGPPLDKSKMLGLVEGTEWNGMLELNRMAFDDYLPRNSESRAIGTAMRLIKRNAPQIKWVVSFADGCSCGDGTIYRASNFVLTDIRANNNIALLPNGEKIHKMTLESNPTTPRRELGGGVLLRHHRREVQFQRVYQADRRDCVAGIPTTVHLFHRQEMSGAAHGSGDTVLPH